MLIYIHGFNSSPASTKAQLVRQRLETIGRGAEFVAPALPDFCGFGAGQRLPARGRL
jgi:predicted esterase YcpF (UPF0227 family)